MTTDFFKTRLPRIKTGFTPMVKAPTSPYSPPGNMVMLLPTAEEQRRNNIIQELVRTMPVAIGMRVKPSSKSVFDKQGYAVVKGIAFSYSQYKGTQKEVHWPKNDNPMIVSAVYENSGEAVDATANYFIPAGDSFDD